MSLDGESSTGQARRHEPALVPPVVLRIDATKNMARFYAMSIEPDLFGGASLVRRWGRIGTRGKVRVDVFKDERQAITSFSWLARSERAVTVPGSALDL